MTERQVEMQVLKNLVDLYNDCVEEALRVTRDGMEPDISIKMAEAHKFCIDALCKKHNAELECMYEYDDSPLPTIRAICY